MRRMMGPQDAHAANEEAKIIYFMRPNRWIANLFWRFDVRTTEQMMHLAHPMH